MPRLLIFWFSILWSSMVGHNLADTLYKTINLNLIIKDHFTNIEDPAQCGTRAVVSVDNSCSGPTYEAQYDYYPYGKVLRKVENPRSRFQSTDHETDLETGYNNRNARWYDDESFSFLSADPHSFFYPSISPFTYLRRNPIIRIDPSGMDDYQINDDGLIVLVKKTDDKTDVLLNTDGSNKIEVEKGILDNILLRNEGKDDQYQVLTLKGDLKMAKSLFEFISSSIAPKKGEADWSAMKKNNHILTLSSGKDKAAAYGLREIENFKKVIFHVHSHPTAWFPSGFDDNGNMVQMYELNSETNLMEPSDKVGDRNHVKQFSPFNSLNWFIYHPPSNKYIQYNEKEILDKDAKF